MDSHEDAELRMLLAHREREWNKRLADMRAELTRKDEEIQREQKRAELMTFIQRRVAEERDEIAPELIDYIQGDSIEAIEASIERAKQKTEQILKGLMEAQMQMLPAQLRIPQQPQQAPQQPQQLTLEQLRAIEVGSAEHMALRRRFGMDKRRGQGIFG